MSHDYLLKYICIGDSGVGKSCLLWQLTDKMFEPFHVPTIGVDTATHIITIHHTKLKLQIWDTAGEEQFRYIPLSAAREADGALLVYDITRRETFDHLASWVESLRQYGSATIMLVGNKCDLADIRAVSTEEAEQFAKEHDLLFVETSAKTDQNVTEVFNKITTTIYKKIQDAEKSGKRNENPKTKIKELQREIRVLEKELEKRDKFIQQTFEGCTTFFSKDDEEEHDAGGFAERVDILGETATISNMTNDDEY